MLMTLGVIPRPMFHFLTSKEMKMQYFHFDKIYAMRRRKHLSFPYVPCLKILLNSSISISSINERKRLYTNARFKCKDVPKINAKQEN
jgi:hypothetical protein